MSIGDIYNRAKGVAIDYPRAIAAFRVGAEGGDASCQYQVGAMHYKGMGVAVDYNQARLWLERAVAQDHPIAFTLLGMAYSDGKGVIPSWRRARELFQRGVELGNSEAAKHESPLAISRAGQNLQDLTWEIQQVHTNVGYNVHDRHFVVHATLLPFRSQVAPLMDKRVEIYGTSRADMNGKRGVAIDFHPMGGAQGDRSTWRYTVQLDSGEGFKLKPASVRVEEGRIRRSK